jgi:hypothetical protein
VTAGNTATKLVQIAEELFTFGCVSEQRGGTSRNPGSDPVAVFTYASPKGNPALKRPLADIRPDLAEVYQLQHGSVPAASALGDAMTVLEGKARKAAPLDGDEDLIAALAKSTDSVATRLVQMAKENFTFGVTTTGEAYAVPIDGPNVARILRGGRRSLRAELAKLYYQKTKGAANAQALADAVLVLEGEAQGADPVEVALRVGVSPIDGRLVLDLGSEDGRAVLIGGYGWEIVEKSPVLFWRTNATLPLPSPDDMGNLQDLRDLLNVSARDWPMIEAWLISALIFDIPHPVLLLLGEHGTAKSSAARLLTSLIDRCASQLRTASRNVEDWAVACAGSWVTCLDNVSDLQHWLQDAICRAVTGDGLLRRELYTNSDVSVLAFRRVIALTSVDPGRLNGDLADRLLSIELERIPEEARAGEKELNEKWAKLHALALGGLLHSTVNVLRVLPTIRNTGLQRMADFSRVLLAVDQVRGTSSYDLYVEQASRTAQQVLESDPVAIAIQEHIKAEWEGTASELLKLLTPDKAPKDWPTTPQGMGGRLVRVAPVLRALGWMVEQGPRTKKRRIWTISPPALSEEWPAGSSPSSPSSPGGPGPQKHWGDAGDDQGDESADRLESGDIFGGGADDPEELDVTTEPPEYGAGDIGDIGDDLAGPISERFTHSRPALSLVAGNPSCTACGRPNLFHPTSIARGVCAACAKKETA